MTTNLEERLAALMNTVDDDPAPSARGVFHAHARGAEQKARHLTGSAPPSAVIFHREALNALAGLDALARKP